MNRTRVQTMNKKLLCFVLFVLGLASVATKADAQSGLEVGSINAILEDNSLRDAATRYVSVFSYFFPEEATRLGFLPATTCSMTAVPIAMNKPNRH